MLNKRRDFVCVTALLAALLTGCGGTDLDLSSNQAKNALGSNPQRSECVSKNPLNSAYFGDLHVHTSISKDSYGWGVRLSPDDAYRYAFGEGEVLLPPNGKNGEAGSRAVAIARPLDFAAVTDHAESLSETRLCIDKNSSSYNSEHCRVFRGRDKGVDISVAGIAKLMNPFAARNTELCGDDGEVCAQLDRDVYGEIIAAAAEWNDNSEDCERTTFIGYEYSSVRLGSNMHRNVIFRNNTVPPNPIGVLEAPRAWMLWDKLNKDCIESGTECDVLAIPHNSNISNGRMFAVDYPGANSKDEQKARAALRIKVEPIVEIMQHKGDSECRNGLPDVLGAVDELCEFEKFVKMTDKIRRGADEVGDCYNGPLADIVPHLGPDCLSSLSFVRNALTEGLKEERRIGVNPYKFGLSASTDTHNALGGGVTEKTWPGHLGMADNSTEKRTAWVKNMGNTSNNPGGLIGVWAPENSRDALFDAMKKKEVFGTSGPRIQPRFFGAWNYPKSLCRSTDRIEQAYSQGVAMGGDLPKKLSEAPVFMASAMADVGTSAQSGTSLQRLQVIKGWVGDDGISREHVFDIAGDANNGASVDLNNCDQSGSGFSQLCAVWQDPEFDASKRAVYYMRAVENPSCRYSAWQCAQFSDVERPESCNLPDVRRAIQERAWSSPIWYTPPTST
jgi:hypothetical protein